jgi:hypothetical protein
LLRRCYDREPVWIVKNRTQTPHDDACLELNSNASNPGRRQVAGRENESSAFVFALQQIRPGAVCISVEFRAAIRRGVNEQQPVAFNVHGTPFSDQGTRSALGGAGRRGGGIILLTEYGDIIVPHTDPGGELRWSVAR